VLCDTELLTGLPEREWRSGRGEMAKYAFLSSPGEPERAASMGAGMLSLPLEEQVAHCVAIKAGVVAADEREGSRRAILNYGHTLAHALEADAIARGRDDAIRHGEAVAIGLVFAARLAMRLGRIGSERVAEHEAVVRGFGLDYRLPAGWDSSALVGYMLRDKKAHHDLTFVLDGPRGVELVTGVDQGDVLATLSDMPVADGLDSHQGL
jgi:5-deoxy-5-amino-3-dehydroquinate synthase